MRVISYERFKYFGHIIRNFDIQRWLLEGQVDGRMGRGRQRINNVNNFNPGGGDIISLREGLCAAHMDGFLGPKFVVCGQNSS